MKACLGEFDELVLLTIAGLGNDASGVSIQQDTEAQCGQTIKIKLG